MNPVPSAPAAPLAALLALSLTSACQADEPSVAESARPLIFGTVDDGHPAAVALSRNGHAFCTGTLVSPKVVMTAAHCVDMLVGDPNVTIFFGSDIEGEGTRIGVRDTIAHPMWTGNLGGVAHDVGLLLMEFPVDPELAVPLSHFDLSERVGAEVERVGFGIYDAATQAQDGKKRTGTTSITQVTSGTDTFIAGDQNLITCSGDSGGPSLMTVDGTTYVAGVHSFGTEGCTTPNNGDTRVELYADDFILPWIQDNDSTCKQDDLCAPIGCQDDPDCQPCGPDGTCTEGCALPDVDCQTQAVGDLCRADSQCTSESCVVWRPEPTTSFCTETCSPGSDICPSGMSCQEIIPLGFVCYYDEEPAGTLGSECGGNAECGSTVCEDGLCTYACDLSKGLGCPDGYECSDLGAGYNCHALPSQDSGGCSVGAAAAATDSRGAGLWALAIALMLLLRAGRRRSAAS